MQLYRVLNVRVVLVNAITWTNGDRISVVTDSSALLDNFQAYSPQITVPHDSAMLLTSVCELCVCVCVCVCACACACVCSVCVCVCVRACVLGRRTVYRLILVMEV